MTNYVELRLQQQGIKPTAMRTLVLEFLMTQNAAVSLKDMDDAFDRADRITLYRTLKTFEKNGLIHHVDDGTGATKYALCEVGCECKPKDLHIHFNCTECHKTICLPKIGIPAFQIPARFVLREVNFTAKGICSDCS